MVDDSPSQEVLVRSFMQECHIKALGSCLSQWRRRALTSHISMVRASQVAHTLCEKAAALSSCTSYQSGYIHRLHRVHPYVAITAKMHPRKRPKTTSSGSSGSPLLGQWSMVDMRSRTATYAPPAAGRSGATPTNGCGGAGARAPTFIPLTPSKRTKVARKAALMPTCTTFEFTANSSASHSNSRGKTLFASTALQ